MRAALFILRLVGFSLADVASQSSSSVLASWEAVLDEQNADVDTSSPPPLYVIHGPDVPLFRLARPRHRRLTSFQVCPVIRSAGDQLARALLYHSIADQPTTLLFGRRSDIVSITWHISILMLSPLRSIHPISSFGTTCVSDMAHVCTCQEHAGLLLLEWHLMIMITPQSEHTQKP